MRTLFRYIRQQPKSVRENYAFGFATVFTVLVATGWFFTASDWAAAPANGVLGKEESAPSFATLLKKAKEQLAATPFADGGEVKKEEEVVVVASSTALVLSAEEVAILQQEFAATATSGSSTLELGTRSVPVLIATTSATTTIQMVTGTQ